MVNTPSLASYKLLLEKNFEGREFIREKNGAPALSLTTVAIFMMALEKLAPHRPELRRSMDNPKSFTNCLEAVEAAKARTENQNPKMNQSTHKKITFISSTIAALSSVTWFSSRFSPFVSSTASLYVGISALIVGAYGYRGLQIHEQSQQHLHDYRNALQEARALGNSYETFFKNKDILSYLEGSITVEMRSARKDSTKYKTYRLAQRELRNCVDYCTVL